MTQDYPFTITLPAIKWVIKAISKNKNRPALSYGALVHKDGCTYLVCTDTHRIHAYQVGVSDPHDQLIVDIRLLLVHMSSRNAKIAKFDLTGSGIMGNEQTSKVQKFGTPFINLLYWRVLVIPPPVC